jgi:HlyD family secretion protein
MQLKSRTLFTVGICVSLLLSGCDRTAESSGPEMRSAVAALPKVATVKPIRRTITQKTVQPGKIEAFSTTPIHARTGGYVESVMVDIGDHVTGPVYDGKGNLVTPGQILAVLSAPEMDEELRQKEAMVDQVAAEVLRAVVAVKVAESMQISAQAGVEECVARQQQTMAQYERWKSELNRMKSLGDAKTVNAKLVEEAEFQFKSADARCRESDAQVKSAEASLYEATVAIEKAQADVQALKAQLRVAEADRDRVSALRNYLQILAPFDGIVTERQIDPGHLVQPSRSAADPPLFVLVQADTVRLFIDVPEADAVLVEPGRLAKIAVSAQGGLSVEGTVTRTGWALQSGTRSLRCEIVLPNPDGQLRPGMYAQVELIVAEKFDVLSVPKSAIVSKDGQTSCVTVTPDGSILRKRVETGIRSDIDIEILSGLDGFEDILTANAAAFSDGQTVEKTKPN